MEPKCPFCGREERPFSSNSADHCRWVGQYAEALSGVRSPSCYETQLAALKSLVREIVSAAETMLNHFVNCSPNMQKLRDTINRPEVKAITEGKDV